MSLLARVVLLMSLWLLAWGEITIANVVSGAAVITVLLLAFPTGATTRVRLNLPAVGRLAAYVVAQLVSSNILMTRETLRRRSTTRPGVLAHRLQRPSDYVVTLMTTIIALSPGTMPVDVQTSPPVIHLHVLVLRDVAPGPPRRRPARGARGRRVRLGRGRRPTVVAGARRGR